MYTTACRALTVWVIILFIVAPYCIQAQQDSTKADALEEVIVTGQFAPQSVRNSVYQVRTIRHEQIQQRGATNVLDVLNNELGIRMNTDHLLGETDISIMGMGGANVKILLDGIPLADRGESRQSLGQIDINSIERIEIVEGPMSVVYGADALAGVINIITKKQAAHAKLQLQARIQEGSAGSYYNLGQGEGEHHEHLSANWQQKNWQAAGYGTRQSSGGWRGSAAWPAKEWKPKDQWFGGIKLGFHKASFNAWYKLDYLDELITVNGAINPNNYKAKDQEYATHRFTHQLQAGWHLRNGWRFSSALSYQDYKRNTSTWIRDYNTGNREPSSGSAEWDITPYRSLFFRQTAFWQPLPQLSIQPGLEIRSDKTSGQRVSGAPEITDYAFFMTAEYNLLHIATIRPGIRFIRNSVYTAPPVIPSVNLKMKLNKATDIRLSYARGYRAPTLRELYFYFFDASHSIQGNPGLEAEFSNSYNASISWGITTKRRHKFQSTLGLFYNDFSNRIDLAVGDNNIYTYLNIARYKTTGLSWNGSFRGKHLSSSLGFSYIGRYNTYYDSDNYKEYEQKEFTWSPEINATISYDFSALKTQVALFYKFTGTTPAYRLSTDSANTVNGVYLAKTNSWHMADLTLTKQVIPQISLQAGIKNLFNVVRIQNNAVSDNSAHSTGGPVLKAYGRSWFTGLLFTWNK